MGSFLPNIRHNSGGKLDAGMREIGYWYQPTRDVPIEEDLSEKGKVFI
jgi:hypothetical protein